ncbi:glycoside hydrolase family 43 protein [Paenibacillus cremeus]|uniref:Glycosyl hydrolase 43 family protein n=1 Tax=Paenibacillus cremeus TaxID=2163881 RepID=A0A559K7J6_9BACL|nr:glycoside hydrolase 43 family protein [Paenibacillus cremeus]TVY08102.1 glycosyl hydrolase 43 family protein [Paenibacillus cremeus]
MKSELSKREAWQADMGDGTFQNPVLFADYSDPDAIRVGDDFYMVASSFSHLPGLPILHSKDLVNWTIVNHVIDRLDLPGYDVPQHGKGVWAPSIRYHAGKYWVFFSTPDEGIFMSTADDPRGKWTPLHMIKEVKGWIDPCPFWDEDGKAYLVHAFAASRCGIKHKLHLFEMSLDGKELLGEGKIIFDGTVEHPTLEGPKMYKRSGYYYIFAPAGGVATGWQTILRSRDIWGPYKDKIVLHQGGTEVNGPHQGAWVELESGESWFLHFQDRGAYGRIVHIQPVRWVDDWPLMGENQNAEGVGEPVSRSSKPKVGGVQPIAVPQTSDDFSGARLGLQWQWQANPVASWYSLEAKPGQLRLYAAPLPEGAKTLYDAPNLLLQKLPAQEFAATTSVELPDSASEQVHAGLMVFGLSYAYLAVARTADGKLRLSQVIGAEGREEQEAEAVALEAASRPVSLRVTVTGNADCCFQYSMDGERFHAIGPSFRAQEGKWVGAKVGIFASGSGSESDAAAYADFESFVIEPLS